MRQKTIKLWATLSVMAVLAFNPNAAVAADSDTVTADAVATAQTLVSDTTSGLVLFPTPVAPLKIVVTDSNGTLILEKSNHEQTLQEFLKEYNYSPKTLRTEDGEKISSLPFPLEKDVYLFKDEYKGSLEKVEIPFSKEVLESNHLPKGEKRVLQEGKKGTVLKTIVTVADLSADPTRNEKAGNVTPNEVHRETYTVLEQPIKKIVEVGIGDESPSPTTTCSNGSSVPATVDLSVQAIHRDVCRLFPDVVTYGTFRGYCTYTCDHHDGIAVDIMVSGDRGWEVAHYLEENYERYNINNMIYSQKIWATYQQYWKVMGDRGSITANHYDHVHISVHSTPQTDDKEH